MQTRHRGSYLEPSVASAGLKRNGVHVFALGVTKNASTKELAGVASDSKSVLTADSFDDLRRVLQIVKEKMCKGTLH